MYGQKNKQTAVEKTDQELMAVQLKKKKMELSCANMYCFGLTLFFQDSLPLAHKMTDYALNGHFAVYH